MAVDSDFVVDDVNELHRYAPVLACFLEVLLYAFPSPQLPVSTIIASADHLENWSPCKPLDRLEPGLGRATSVSSQSFAIIRAATIAIIRTRLARSG